MRATAQILKLADCLDYFGMLFMKPFQEFIEILSPIARNGAEGHPIVIDIPSMMQPYGNVELEPVKDHKHLDILRGHFLSSRGTHVSNLTFLAHSDPGFLSLGMTSNSTRVPISSPWVNVCRSRKWQKTSSPLSLRIKPNPRSGIHALHLPFISNQQEIMRHLSCLACSLRVRVG
jgi:hypothetical protein